MKSGFIAVLFAIAVIVGAGWFLNGPLMSRAQAQAAAVGSAEGGGTLLPVSGKLNCGELQVLDQTGKPRGLCPLKHTDVVAGVAGFVARVDVTQEFVNPLDEKIEAVYVFPLPQDAAVDRMEMTVGERTIRGEIKRREEARKIYEKAKQTGHVASLLDQERPNIFTQSVANIMPGERVLIKISYIDLLKYEAGQYEFTFPMVVGPRFIPGQPTGKSGEGWSPDTTRVPDASKITPPVTPEGTRAGHDISFRVSINAGVPVSDIRSVLHEVVIDRVSSSEVEVALKDRETIPNKDFILRWQVAGEDVRSGLLPNTRAAGDGYFAFLLVPPKSPKPEQIRPKEMIFVIDSSGSQMGWPIEKSKETMKLCVEKMNAGDTFQMLAFSNEVVRLFDQPQPNTPANRALAQEFLSSRLGSGGTQMLKAIIAALTPPRDPKRLRIVCFMTDGYVGNDFEILDTIQKEIGDARLFSFGIGNSVNRFLLDGMAEMGRGAVEYVTLQEQGASPAERFNERISKPILTDISIDWGELDVEDVYPEQIPDLFSAKPVILKGRYHRAMKGFVTVHGRLGDKPWEERVPVNLPADMDENQALPSLWARARIANLTARDYLGIQRGVPDPKLQEEITLVALDYSLMSQFTSFVAVEEKIVTEGGKPKKVAVPVEMPEGVSYQGVFGDRKEGRVQGMLAATSVYQAYGGYASQSPAATTAPTVAGAAPSFKPTKLDSSVSRSAEKKAEPPKPKPVDRRQQLLTARLDRMLIDIAAKLDKNGDYQVPGKLVVKQNKVRVGIRLSVVSNANLAKLAKLGFEIRANGKTGSTVSGVAPVKNLEALALLEFVRKIFPTT